MVLNFGFIVDDTTGAVLATIETSGALPANYRDGSALSDALKQAIISRRVRWDGSGFVAIARTPLPLASSFTDRQLLEMIAKSLRLAR